MMSLNRQAIPAGSRDGCPRSKRDSVFSASFLGTSRGTDWGGLIAGATLTAIPVVVFFLLVQRRIAQGDAERQVMAMAKGLRRRGWRVSVVALSGSGGQAAAELTAVGVQFLSLEMRKGLTDPRGWFRFNRWLKSERPQVVHAHLPHAALMARWSRLSLPMQALSGSGFAGQVLVDTLHSSFTGRLARRIGYRCSDWLADSVTAVSQSVAETHLAAGMVNRNKLSVLPNGVDVEDFHPDSSVRSDTRRELGLGDEFLWLAAGRLEPVKDYPTLLNAFAKLPEQARLLIAGAGTLQNELAQITARLGLERRVRFLGFQPDVKPWMRAADGFVLSSRWEGLPVGLLEAGACGGSVSVLHIKVTYGVNVTRNGPSPVAQPLPAPLLSG